MFPFGLSPKTLFPGMAKHTLAKERDQAGKCLTISPRNKATRQYAIQRRFRGTCVRIAFSHNHPPPPPGATKSMCGDRQSRMGSQPNKRTRVTKGRMHTRASSIPTEHTARGSTVGRQVSIPSGYGLEHCECFAHSLSPTFISVFTVHHVHRCQRKMAPHRHHLHDQLKLHNSHQPQMHLPAVPLLSSYRTENCLLYGLHRGQDHKSTRIVLFEGGWEGNTRGSGDTAGVATAPTSGLCIPRSSGRWTLCDPPPAATNPLHFHISMGPDRRVERSAYGLHLGSSLRGGVRGPHRRGALFPSFARE